MQNNNIKIAVAYHKAAHIVSNEIFCPIQVGAANSKIDLGIVKDSENDNISYLNPYYCELTALYYLWKNYPNFEYYGLCHYRRFPTFKRQKALNYGFQYVCYFSARILHIINSKIHFTILPYVITKESELDNELNQFSTKIQKVICSQKYDYYVPRHFISSAYSNYDKFSIACGYQRIEELKMIVKNHYSDYYKELEQCLMSNKMHATNICIMKKDIFNDYCKFLFDILQHHFAINVEQTECISHQYLRQSGFLAEVLTDVYIRKLKNEHKKHKNLNILYVVPDEDIDKQNKVIRFLVKCKIFNPKFIK